MIGCDVSNLFSNRSVFKKKFVSFISSFFVVVQSLSCVRLFVTPWTAACQASLSSASPGVCSNSCPLTQWCYPTISSFVTSLSSCPQSFPASGSFPVNRFFASGSQRIGASASASVLSMDIQGWFPLGLTCWSLCCPRDSQKSSPAPQFKSIYSLVLSLFYGPTLTSVHDYWKNHNFDYMELCQ